MPPTVESVLDALSQPRLLDLCRLFGSDPAPRSLRGSGAQGVAHPRRGAHGRSRNGEPPHNGHSNSFSDIAVPPYCPLSDADREGMQALEDEVIDRLYVLNAERAREEELLARGQRMRRRGASGGKESLGVRQEGQPVTRSLRHYTLPARPGMETSPSRRGIAYHSRDVTLAP